MSKIWLRAYSELMSLMSNLYTVPSEIIEEMTKMLTQGSDCSTLDNIRLCTALLT